MSQMSMQTKMIIEMQQILKQMKEEHQLLKDHIHNLESIATEMAEAKIESDSYKSAALKANNLEKKINHYMKKKSWE